MSYPVCDTGIASNRWRPNFCPFASIKLESARKNKFLKTNNAGVLSNISLSTASTVSLRSDGDPMEAEENHQAPILNAKGLSGTASGAYRW